MLRVALTGGLGSGKSAVGEMFSELGARVIDADTIGRNLMSPGQPVYAAIVRSFGDPVVKVDGSLDRQALARLAFQGGRAGELNRIVHPAVIAAEEEWMRCIFAADSSAVAIVESALIFEAEAWGTAPGWVRRFDTLILLAAPDEVKIARFVSRKMAENGDESMRPLWIEDARARLASQIPDEEKIARCDYVIATTASLEETCARVTGIYRELAQKARLPSS